MCIRDSSIEVKNRQVTEVTNTINNDLTSIKDSITVQKWLQEQSNDRLDSLSLKFPSSESQKNTAKDQHINLGNNMDNSKVIYGPNLMMEVNENSEKIQGFVNNLGISYGPTLKTIVKKDTEENLGLEDEGINDNNIEEGKENSKSATSILDNDGRIPSRRNLIFRKMTLTMFPRLTSIISRKKSSMMTLLREVKKIPRH